MESISYLLENRPSISLQPLVLVIHDSRFLSLNLCSVEPTVRHGFLAPSIPFGVLCLSIGTGCSCADSTGDPKIIAAMRRHISIPFVRVRLGRRQVRRKLYCPEGQTVRGWKECSALRS